MELSALAACSRSCVVIWSTERNSTEGDFQGMVESMEKGMGRAIGWRTFSTAAPGTRSVTVWACATAQTTARDASVNRGNRALMRSIF